MKKYANLFFRAACALAMVLTLSGCLPAVLVSRSAPDEALEAKVDEWEDTVRDLEDAWNDLDDDWSAKGHYWQVLDAGGQEVLVINAEEAVQRVDDLVNGGMEWKQASSVEGEKALYTYVFMQQKTLLAGQDPDAEREYEEVLRFTVYEDTDVMSMTVLESLGDYLPSSVVDWEDLLTIHAKAPAETAEALRDPARFTEEG